MHHKKFAALLVAMVLICIGFSSCGSGQRDEIIIWWISGQQNEQIINDAINRYKENNPDAKIRVVLRSGMDIFQAYKIALNDDRTRPDVAILDHVYVQALANEGVIANLSALGADEYKDLYPEGLWNANLYNNKAYALPLSANTIALMYNSDILQEAGVTEIPQTLDELYEACQKVEDSGKIAFAQPINTFAVMAFMSYVGRLGGQIVSNDYKTITINTDPKVKEALIKWKKFTDEGWANKNEFEEARFYNGEVAFIEMGSWNLSKVFGASALFDCGVVEMIKIDPDLPNYSGLGLYSLVVAEKSIDKNTAYDLAKFLSSDTEFQLVFNKSLNLFPVTFESLQDPYYVDNEILSVYASQLEKVIPRPATPIWPELEQILVNMLRASILNNNVDAALNTAQNKAQAATDRVFG